MKVVAVVVTYNRKKLLQECIDAILSQSTDVEKIIVVDNCSTDNTSTLFEKNAKYDLCNICYIKMKENLGGAGGFYEGIKKAYELEADWIWIMDDDTIPRNNALENLKNSIEQLREKGETISFMSSSVIGPKGEAMNVPEISYVPTSTGYPDWYRYLSMGLVKITSATFVSIIISKDAINKVGLPFKEYFIWGDDAEYTMRLTKHYGNAFMCGDSEVIHKRYNVSRICIGNEENISRIKNYYYFFRNNLITIKEYKGRAKAIKMILRWQLDSFQMLFNKNIEYRIKKFYILQKGIWAYVFGCYDKKKFLNRIKYYKVKSSENNS